MVKLGLEECDLSRVTESSRLLDAESWSHVWEATSAELGLRSAQALREASLQVMFRTSCPPGSSFSSAARTLPLALSLAAVT